MQACGEASSVEMAERGDYPLYDGKAAGRKPSHAKRLAADDAPT
jgi:hypothetical protein